jgi:DNA-directed RNA polymerase specialized sigma24 family protein
MPSPSLTLLRTQTDERLVDLVRRGHERAFEAIVERHRKPLLRAARRVLPEGRAEDALQQALPAAWTALQRGDEVRELRPWLYRIVHHTALNARARAAARDARAHEDARRRVGPPRLRLLRRRRSRAEHDAGARRGLTVTRTPSGVSHQRTTPDLQGERP